MYVPKVIEAHLRNRTAHTSEGNRLASFELNYVSPENHKIEQIYDKSGKSKVKFGGEKQASRIFCLQKVDVLNLNFNMEKSKI